MERRARAHGLLVGLTRIAALALLAGVAGCGGTASSERAEQPPPPSRKQFALRLGDLCQKHTDRQVVAVERFERQHGVSGEPTPRQSELELVQVILPIVRSTIREAGEMRPPAGEGPELRAFVRALRHGVTVSEEDPSWVATGKFEPFMQAREASAALGTYYCGQA